MRKGEWINEPGLTPVTDTLRLLGMSIEHGCDNHEAGGDSTFAHPQ